jgi:hypothetical protein
MPQIMTGSVTPTTHRSGINTRVCASSRRLTVWSLRHHHQQILRSKVRSCIVQKVTREVIGENSIERYVHSLLLYDFHCRSRCCGGMSSCMEERSRRNSPLPNAAKIQSYEQTHHHDHHVVWSGM